MPRLFNIRPIERDRLFWMVQFLDLSSAALGAAGLESREEREIIRAN